MLNLSDHPAASCGEWTLKEIQHLPEIAAKDPETSSG